MTCFHCGDAATIADVICTACAADAQFGRMDFIGYRFLLPGEEIPRDAEVRSGRGDEEAWEADDSDWIPGVASTPVSANSFGLCRRPVVPAGEGFRYLDEGEPPRPEDHEGRRAMFAVFPAGACKCEKRLPLGVVVRRPFLARLLTGLAGFMSAEKPETPPPAIPAEVCALCGRVWALLPPNTQPVTELPADAPAQPCACPFPTELADGRLQCDSCKLIWRADAWMTRNAVYHRSFPKPELPARQEALLSRVLFRYAQQQWLRLRSLLEEADVAAVDLVFARIEATWESEDAVVRANTRRALRVLSDGMADLRGHAHLATMAARQTLGERQPELYPLIAELTARGFRGVVAGAPVSFEYRDEHVLEDLLKQILHEPERSVLHPVAQELLDLIVRQRFGAMEIAPETVAAITPKNMPPPSPSVLHRKLLPGELLQGGDCWQDKDELPTFKPGPCEFVPSFMVSARKYRPTARVGLCAPDMMTYIRPVDALPEAVLAPADAEREAALAAGTAPPPPLTMPERLKQPYPLPPVAVAEFSLSTDGYLWFILSDGTRRTVPAHQLLVDFPKWGAGLSADRTELLFGEERISIATLLGPLTPT